MWTGWLWRFGMWNRVCDGSDIGIAHRKLERKAREMGVTKNTHGALTQGGYPMFVPPDVRRSEATMAEVENP